jgi:hypothetical protein
LNVLQVVAEQACVEQMPTGTEGGNRAGTKPAVHAAALQQPVESIKLMVLRSVMDGGALNFSMKSMQHVMSRNRLRRTKRNFQATLPPKHYQERLKLLASQACPSTLFGSLTVLNFDSAGIDMLQMQMARSEAILRQAEI